MRGVHRIKQLNIEEGKKSGDYDPVNDPWPGDPEFEEQQEPLKPNKKASGKSHP